MKQTNRPSKPNHFEDFCVQILSIPKLDLKKPHFHKLGQGFLDLEASFYTLAGYLLFVALVLLVFLGLMGLGYGNK